MKAYKINLLKMRDFDIIIEVPLVLLFSCYLGFSSLDVLRLFHISLVSRRLS